MLTIRLLGGASLEGPDGPLTGRAAQRKPLALLAILATDRARALSRDRLMLLLAPELDTERARHLLRDTTYALRAALGQEAVVGAGDELRLDRSQVLSDLWEFEAALDAGDLAGAVGVYAGPFLDGFHLKDSPEFDAWASTERERIASRYREALDALAQAAAAAGDHPVAARWWAERLAADPLNPLATLGLMEALAATGDTAGALRRAATHAALLHAELGSPPDRQVEALAARLRASPPNVSHPIAAATPESPAPRPDPPPRPGAARRSGPPWGWAGILAIPILGALLFLSLRPPDPVSTEFDPRRVAVAPFRNATGDASLDPIGHMAADWITQGLSESGLVQVVPLATVLGSSRLVGAAAERFGDDTAPVRSIAAGTGAGTIVYGAFYREGDDLLFQARIGDASHGVVLHAVEPVRAPASAPLAAIEALRQATLLGLAPLVDQRLRASAALVSSPPTYSAYRDYAEGVERFLAGELGAALARFERASAADTNYVTPLLWAALARWNSGDQLGADSITAGIESRGHHLAPHDDAILRSLRAWARGDWSAAYDAAARGLRVAPGSGMAGAQVATEARRLNRLDEARRGLEMLDPDRGELAGWVYYWLELADVHHLRGDHRAERRVVTEALRRHPEDLVARIIELRFLAAARRVADVDRRLDDALASPVSPFFGALARESALELFAHGRDIAGRDVLERALRWYQDRLASPSGAGQGVTRGMVRPMMMLGQYGDAIAILDGLAPPPGAPGAVDHRGQRALLAQLTGDAGDADARLEEMNGLDVPLANGRVEWWRAAVLGARGDCEAALTMLRTALGRGVEFGMELHHAWELAPLRACAGWQAVVRARG